MDWFFVFGFWVGRDGLLVMLEPVVLHVDIECEMLLCFPLDEYSALLFTFLLFVFLLLLRGGRSGRPEGTEDQVLLKIGMQAASAVIPFDNGTTGPVGRSGTGGVIPSSCTRILFSASCRCVR